MRYGSKEITRRQSAKFHIGRISRTKGARRNFAHGRKLQATSSRRKRGQVTRLRSEFASTTKAPCAWKTSRITPLGLIARLEPWEASTTVGRRASNAIGGLLGSDWRTR